MVRALIGRRVLRSVRIGRRTLLTPETLARFVADHEEDGPERAA